MPLERFIFEVFEPAVSSVEGAIYQAPHLSAWCALWEKNRFFAVVAARGFLKSIFAKAILAYALMTHRSGAFDAFFFSAKRELAQEHMRRLKLYLSPLAEQWGWRDDTEGEALLRYVKPGCYWSCRPEGVDSASRGRRANLLVCDDVLDARKPSTYVDIQRVLSSVQRRIVPIMKDRDARIFLAGTPIIEDDVIGWVQQNPAFKTARLPALLRNDGSEFPPGTPLDEVFSQGVPTWPERYPLAELASMRKLLGDKFFGAEYMLWPIGPSDSFIPAYVLERSLGNVVVEGDGLVFDEDLCKEG